MRQEYDTFGPDHFTSVGVLICECLPTESIEPGAESEVLMMNVVLLVITENAYPTLTQVTELCRSTVVGDEDAVERKVEQVYRNIQDSISRTCNPRIVHASLTEEHARSEEPDCEYAIWVSRFGCNYPTKSNTEHIITHGGLPLNVCLMNANCPKVDFYVEEHILAHQLSVLVSLSHGPGQARDLHWLRDDDESIIPHWRRYWLGAVGDAEYVHPNVIVQGSTSDWCNTVGGGFLRLAGRVTGVTHGASLNMTPETSNNSCKYCPRVGCVLCGLGD